MLFFFVDDFRRFSSSSSSFQFSPLGLGADSFLSATPFLRVILLVWFRATTSLEHFAHELPLPQPGTADSIYPLIRQLLSVYSPIMGAPQKISVSKYEDPSQYSWQGKAQHPLKWLVSSPPTLV